MVLRLFLSSILMCVVCVVWCLMFEMVFCVMWNSVVLYVFGNCMGGLIILSVIVNFGWLFLCVLCVLCMSSFSVVVKLRLFSRVGCRLCDMCCILFSVLFN